LKIPTVMTLRTLIFAISWSGTYPQIAASAMFADGNLLPIITEIKQRGHQ
jgi:hypothetical protein